MAEPRTGVCAPWITPERLDELGCCEIAFNACLGPATALTAPADEANLTLTVTSGGPGLWTFRWDDPLATNTAFLTDIDSCLSALPENVVTMTVDLGGVTYEFGLPAWAVTSQVLNPLDLTVDLDFSAVNPGVCDLTTLLQDWESDAALFVSNTGGAPTVVATTNQACSPQQGAAQSITPAQASLYIEAASNILFWMTGRRWPGLCTTSVRPCDARCTSASRTLNGLDTNSLSLGGWGLPYLLPDGWRNCFCDCSECYVSDCGCDTLPAITMPEVPVVSLQSVFVDGVDLVASGDVRIDNYREIVRTDGMSWPCCQDLTGDPTVVGDNAWEITYTYGRTPPPEAEIAVAVLACEIALSCGGAALRAQCRLPRGVQTVTRQGVTMEFQALQSLLTIGSFGIPEIDMFLLAHPKPGRPSFVISPDTVENPRRVDT